MQACVVTLWALIAACRNGEAAERSAAAEAAAAAVQTHLGLYGSLCLPVVAAVLAVDTAGFGVDGVAAAHGLAATWRAAGVAEVQPLPGVAADDLLGWALAMVDAGSGRPVVLRGLPFVRVVLVERPADLEGPPHTLARGQAAGAGSALRSFYVQHRLINGLPTLPGVAPATAKAVVQMVVDRLLAVPGGLEPLTLLQQDGGLLQSGIRVAVLAVLTARAAGWPDETLADVGVAGLLHDVGALLDEADPGPAAFSWLLERGAGDLWLRCALVARRWRFDHGALDEVGNSGLAVAALVRVAASIEAELRAANGGSVDLAARLDALALAGAFPAELVAAVPPTVLASC